MNKAIEKATTENDLPFLIHLFGEEAAKREYTQLKKDHPFQDKEWYTRNIIRILTDI